MSDADRHERAADRLCDVVLAMDDVDLNALLDEDAREFLELKQRLGEMTAQYRRSQHTAERNHECDAAREQAEDATAGGDPR